MENGFRRISFFMKLEFNFVTKPTALSIRVLCNKYKEEETCLISISRNICSYVCRSLSKIWDQFRDRVFGVLVMGVQLDLLRTFGY